MPSDLSRRSSHRPSPGNEPGGVSPIAGLLAWVLPGLGHVYRGEPARGAMVAVGVLGLFVGGVLIGGLAVVDTTSSRFETRISFAGQVFAGPVVIATNRIHQSRYKAPDPQDPSVRRHAGPEESIRDGRIVPGGPPTLTLSVGRINEIGVLYVLIAGMVNFIAILDALLPGRPIQAGGRGHAEGQEQGGVEARVSVIEQTLAEGTGPRQDGSGGGA